MSIKAGKVSTGIFAKWKALRKSSGVQEAFWMFAEQALGMITAFAASAIVTRAIGPINIGIINYAAALAALLSPLAMLGLEQTVIRWFAEQKYPEASLLRIASRLLWVSNGVSALGLAMWGSWQFHGGSQNFALICAAVAMLANVSQSYVWLLRSRTLYKSIVKPRFVLNLAFQLTRVTIALSGSSLSFLLILGVVEAWTNALMVRHFARSNVSLDFETGDLLPKSVIGDLLKSSWPIIMTNLGIMVYMKIDVVMIQAMLDLRHVGIYSVASKLSEVWNCVPMIIGQITFPIFIRMRSRDFRRYQRAYRRVLLGLILLAIFVAVGAHFTSDLVVRLIYGNGFAEAALPLSIHIWSAIPVFAGVMISNQYLIADKSRMLVIGCFVGACSNIILNLLLIPRMGVAGAAMATAFSYALSVAVPLIFMRDCRMSAWARI